MVTRDNGYKGRVLHVLKVILHKPSLGLNRRREARAREQLLGVVCCVCVLARVHQTSRAYRATCEDARAERWSTQNAESPRLLFRTALSDGMFCLEAGGGVQLACGLARYSHGSRGFSLAESTREARSASRQVCGTAEPRSRGRVRASSLSTPFLKI